MAFLANCMVLAGAAGPRSPGPDIYVVANDLFFTLPGSADHVTEAYWGTNVTINVTVRNAGDAPTTLVNVNITYDDNVVIALKQVTTPILPLECATVEAVWNTENPNLLPYGPHTVNITVDDTMDDNLDNNTASAQFTILEPLKPKVYVSDIIMNNNALVGDVVMITAVLKNVGTAPQTDPDGVKFFVGTQLLTKDPLPYEVPLVNDNVTSTEVIYNWNVTQPGKFLISVQVVSTGVKAECSHFINVSYSMPNVYITSVSVDKATIMQGESVTVTVKLKNNGTKAATDEEIWFLMDNATSPSSSNYTVYKSVPKGNIEVTQLFTWNSSDAAPGNHTFRVKVPNSEDVNNSRVSPVVNVLPRTPKMAMIAFDIDPDKVASGSPATLSATLENTGTADAYNQEVRFFLTSIETYPIAIKKVNVKAGGQAVVNATYTPEIGENNTRQNIFAKFVDTVLNHTLDVTTTVAPKADLMVLNASFPTDMVTGQTYYITAIISNNGKVQATNFTVKFNIGTELPYLVKNLDLANGQTLEANWSFTPTIPGSHLKLKVDADATSVVAEANEFNNVLESDPSVTVRAPPSASVELLSVSPAQKTYTVPTGAVANVKLTMTLQNKGEKEGLVLLTVREGPTVVITANVTIPANQTVTVSYKWNITGAKTHTAKVAIEGADVGLITSRVISVDLAHSTPGFELLVVAAAVAAVAVLAGRRRK